MPKYLVALKTAAFFSKAVEAEDEEQAYEKVYEEAPSEVCAQCSGWARGYTLDLDEVWEDDSVEVIDD